jgi:REP-associated tyrosine transposase
MRAQRAKGRRSRPLRVESNDVVWFVTTRTIEERYWLHPLLANGAQPRNRAARRMCAHLERRLDKRLQRWVTRANERRRPHQPVLTLQDAKRIAKGLIGSAFARAQRLHKVEVFGLVAMSNHLHALVRTKGKNLAGFMRDVKARITEAVNLLTGKSGPLWARRYDAQPAVDDEGCCERQGYLLDNPRKANLVADSQHWPGLLLAFGLADEDRLEFEYLDRVAWHDAGSPDDLTPFFRTATLELSPLPVCEGMSREACRASTLSWMEAARAKHEADLTPEERARFKTPLGIDKVLQTEPESRPKAPSFRERPYVFGSPEARKRYTAAVTATAQHHAELSERYRNGERDVRFPDGTYPPPILRAA